MPTINPRKYSANKFGLPYLGFGLGLRAQHYDYIIKNKPAIDWFEIISENYMDSAGRPREKLDEIRATYPIAMHGVSLSIGSADLLNTDYLRKLKQLADDIKPQWISDHLCFTGINGKNTHDLLPVPLTREALNHMVPRIKQVQDFLGRPLLLENPSSYLTYRADEIAEYDFMAELAEKADCALLLDVNNIYVASFNQRLDPRTYINAIPKERVVQMHLAGHTHNGTHIVDTHDNHVTDDVWKLYNYARSKLGNVSTMIEWDANIPDFPILEAELNKARLSTIIPGKWHETKPKLQTRHSNQNLQELQTTLQTAILEYDHSSASALITPKENFPPAAQLSAYTTAYRLRLAEILLDDYTKTAKFLGEDKMKEYVRDFIDRVPSTFYNTASYSWSFADFLPAGTAFSTADLERKTAKCFDLKNSPAAKPKDFANLTPEAFLELKIFPRTASFLETYEPDKLHCIIYRHEELVYQLELEPAEFEILQHLKNGKPLGKAIDALTTNVAPQQIQNWFSRWLANSVLSV